MFIGVDHGTTAIRFATPEGRCWDLARQEASHLSAEEIVERIAQNLGQGIVDLVALSYSMGDGLTRIVRLEDAPNRGLVQQDGAGLHVGGGTRVFEAIQASGWPAILLPGIHRASDIDPRLKVFSHGMSPEKVGLAYGVFRGKSNSFIVCDASSNTVTFAVLQGKIIGAIDAPIFAPGLMQGPLDVRGHKRCRLREDDGEPGLQLRRHSLQDGAGKSGAMPAGGGEPGPRIPIIIRGHGDQCPSRPLSRPGRAKPGSIPGRQPRRKAEQARI